MKTIFLTLFTTALLLIGAQYIYETAWAKSHFVQYSVSTTPTPETPVWLDYEPAVVELEGRLIIKTYYGPPNFGEDPETDSKETGTYLELKDPVNVRGKADDIIDGRSVENVKVVQLVRSEPHQKMIGKTVRVKGTLFGAHTGHHHTDVLMSVQEIVLVETEN